jgi:hypothetical protein
MVVVGALRIILVILAFNGGLLDRSVFTGVAADSATMETAMMQLSQQVADLTLMVQRTQSENQSQAAFIHQLVQNQTDQANATSSTRPGDQEGDLPMNGGGPSRRPKMQLNKIMDTSLVTKAKPFSGDKSDSVSFAFQFRAHLVASSCECKGFLKRIEGIDKGARPVRLR